jgi:hypothetical protein
MLEPSVASIVNTLTNGIRAVLGPQLIGVYVIGSAVSGGFDPGVSDIDLITVTETDVMGLDLPALEAVTRGFVRERPEWTERVEVVYVGRSTLRAFRSGGSLAVVSPGESFHVRHDAIDWTQTWYQLRELSATVTGPPPTELVSRIDWSDFIRALMHTADAIRERDCGDQTPGGRAYGVLTACRTLATVRTGRVPTKQQSAAWVSERMPEWRWLIDAALRCRASGGREGFDDQRTRTATGLFLDRVAAELSDG